MKPVRAIVPYPVGAGTDIMARAICARLSQAWGMYVVVDNRGGGGTIIGTEIAKWEKVIRAAKICID